MERTILCYGDSLTWMSRFGPGLTAPECLIVFPPLPGSPKGLMKILVEGSEEEFGEVAKELRTAFETLPLDWIDAGRLVDEEGEDGVDLSPDSNRKLAKALDKKIREMPTSGAVPGKAEAMPYSG